MWGTSPLEAILVGTTAQEKRQYKTDLVVLRRAKQSGLCSLGVLLLRAKRYHVVSRGNKCSASKTRPTGWVHAATTGFTRRERSPPVTLPHGNNEELKPFRSCRAMLIHYQCVYNVPGRRVGGTWSRLTSQSDSLGVVRSRNVVVVALLVVSRRTSEERTRFNCDTVRF